MEKRAKLILIAGIIIISLLLSGFAFAKNHEKENQEIKQTEEETSPKQVFMQYLEDKIAQLSDEEKEKIQSYQKMEPAEAFLEIIEKLQSQTSTQST